MKTITYRQLKKLVVESTGSIDTDINGAAIHVGDRVIHYLMGGNCWVDELPGVVTDIRYGRIIVDHDRGTVGIVENGDELEVVDECLAVRKPSKKFVGESKESIVDRYIDMVLELLEDGEALHAMEYFDRHEAEIAELYPEEARRLNGLINDAL